jgi:CHAD domain-containing protein
MNAVADTFSLGLSLREMDVLRSALRMLEENHKRNDFKTLALEAQELRSKVNDTLITGNLNRGV